MPENPIDDDEPAGGAAADGVGCGDASGAGERDGDGAHQASAGAGRRAAHCAALDAMTELLREQARGWARQLRVLQELDDLASLGMSVGVAQFPQLEMAGCWQVSQLTASRWLWEAQRFAEALPRTFALLSRGELLEHQARVLLHRTRSCPVELAQAVEAAVLPDGAELCRADLTRRVDRAVLRLEAERDGPAAAQRQADAAAQRRTFGKALPDGMGLAGAVLTAEQLVAWQAGLDVLERRERRADRDAGVERTAEQRRADLFAALPAIVLAGTAQDRARQQGAGQQNAGQQDGAGQDRAAALLSPLTSVPAVVRGAASGSGAAPSPGAATGADTSTGNDLAGPADHARVAGPLVPWTLGPEQLAAQIVINVHVPVSTILELSQEPGTLDRYGPLRAEHIRLLRPRSWRRIMADADSGRPIAVDDRPTPAADTREQAREQIVAMLRLDVVVDADEPQHDPSARLARLVDVRDVHCCGPGCSMTHTHRDHLEPYPTGPTSARNLGRLSPRCHRAKHAGWTLERHADGSVTWTSPLGRVYHRPSPHAPPPHVDLTADPPPPRPRPVGRPRPDDDDRCLRLDDLRPREKTADDASAGAADDGNATDEADSDQQPPRPQTAESPRIDEDDDPPPF